MKVLTKKNIQQFVNEWVLQSNIDYKPFLKNFIFQYYETNYDIFEDIEEALLDIAETLSINTSEEYLETQVQKKIGNPFSIRKTLPSTNPNQDLKFWIKKLKLDKESIEELYLDYLIEFNEITNPSYETLKEQKKTNFDFLALPEVCNENPHLFSFIWWELFITLNHIDFETLLVEKLKDSALKYPNEKIKLQALYQNSLPNYSFSNSLFDIKENYRTRFLFFKHHLNDKSEISAGIKDRKRAKEKQSFNEICKKELDFEVLFNEYRNAQVKRKVAMLFALYELEYLNINPKNLSGSDINYLLHDFFSDNKGSIQSCNSNKKLFSELYIQDSHKFKDTVKESDKNVLLNEKKRLSLIL